MNNINKKCILDSDCENNSMCAFNDNDFNHYCMNNEVNDLYYGCLNGSELNNTENIESNSTIEHSNHKNCIDFSRRQINKDGLEYNYMVFKPKKNVYVDTTTINIYLKCEDEILAIIPYNDYFTIKCDENQQNCTLESKESLLNFIIQNSQNCTKKIYLEIIYECENERIKKAELIPVYIDNYKDIIINLTCPIDINNDRFKSKCQAIYLESDINNNTVDKNKNLYECKTPLYKIPRIVKNINNYKKLKVKNSNLEIKDYDNKINEKIEDLKKLEAEKYIRLKQIQTGETISIDQAYEEISNYPLDKLINNFSDNWKIYNNYDAAEKLFTENESILKFYGLVYTLKDAIKIATDNDQSLFVWYHNSYEINNYASKLYFIDIYNFDDDLFHKSNWTRHENVTTGILKIQLEHFLRDNLIFDENYENDENDNNNNQQNNLNDMMDKTKDNTYLIKQKYSELLDSKLNETNINNNVINDLNNKITTFGQAIKMNNYETGINNKILLILTVIGTFIVLIFVVVLVYFNNLTAGKIKMFGM